MLKIVKVLDLNLALSQLVELLCSAWKVAGHLRQLAIAGQLYWDVVHGPGLDCSAQHCMWHVTQKTCCKVNLHYDQTTARNLSQVALQ